MKKIIWIIVLIALASLATASDWYTTGQFAQGTVNFYFNQTGLWNRTPALMSLSNFGDDTNLSGGDAYADDFVLTTGGSCCGAGSGSKWLYNETDLINNSDYLSLNWSTINDTIDDRAGDTSVPKWLFNETDLINASDYLSLNWTTINNTCDTRIVLANTSMKLYVDSIDNNTDTDTNHTVSTGLNLTNGVLGLLWVYLSNFTDDLGDRGYTHLTNFTDDVGYIDTNTSVPKWLFNETDFINDSDYLELNWTTLNATMDARDTDTDTNTSDDGITLQGENITGGTIDFDRLPALTQTHTLAIANITGLISSFQCSGSDQLTNVTINNSEIYGVCTAQGAGGSPKIGGSPYLYNDSSTIYLNETYLNLTLVVFNDTMKAYVDSIDNDTDTSVPKWLFNETDLINASDYLSLNWTTINNTCDTRIVLANTSMKLYVDSVDNDTSVSKWLFNETDFINDSDYFEINWSTMNDSIYVISIIVNATMKLYADSIDNDTSVSKWAIDNIWLENVSDVLTFDATLLNETITVFNTSMKTYVDAQDVLSNTSIKNYCESTMLNLTGGTMGGNLNISYYNITTNGTGKYSSNGSCAIIYGTTSTLYVC